MASGKLHRATSGGWWVVTNHHDSGLHRHPTTARGFAETVNWALKDPEIIDTHYSELAGFETSADRVDVKRS
jgi:hypothetical protein